MAALYELAIMGESSGSQAHAVETIVGQALSQFGLTLGGDVAWHSGASPFQPSSDRSAAALFFCTPGALLANLNDLLSRGVPIVPVVATGPFSSAAVPSELKPLNGLAYDEAGPERIAAALLECAGLLPRQRRVFLSYRRDEARGAALQLFDELSTRGFDVFLDTNGIPPAADFQMVLWHRLCDCDVLVMLDTPSYFESRWTAAEFGRALSKGISVLRVGWPNLTASKRAETASSVDLADSELDGGTGRLTSSAIGRVCSQVEIVRSQSHAVRTINLHSSIKLEVERIGGSVAGVGPRNAIYVQLPDNKNVVALPTVGVPTSTHLHDASTEGGGNAAVIYDSVGVHPTWQSHLDWLGSQISTARLVKSHEVGWRLADWIAL